MKKESGKDYMYDEKDGYIHSCPTNLGTKLEHQYMLIFLGGLSTVWTNLKLDVKNIIFSLVEPEENLVARQDTLMIFPTSTDWDTLRFSLFRK